MFWSQHLGCWGQNTSRIQNKGVYATLCLQVRAAQRKRWSTHYGKRSITYAVSFCQPCKCTPYRETCHTTPHHTTPCHYRTAKCCTAPRTRLLQPIIKVCGLSYDKWGVTCHHRTAKCCTAPSYQGMRTILRQWSAPPPSPPRPVHHYL